MLNFQRKNSKSNAQVGKDFEKLVRNLLSEEFPSLEKNVSFEIGFEQKKSHKFDLGSIEQKIIIECKSHTWTESNKVPSAKMTTWDQTLLYFSLAPNDLKKIFVVKKDMNSRTNESLCEYYLRTHNHLIPSGVEFRELDEESKILSITYP